MKLSISQSEYYLDPTLLKASRTEYGLNAINEVLCLVLEKIPEVQVHLRCLSWLDGIYDGELSKWIAPREKSRLLSF